MAEQRTWTPRHGGRRVIEPEQPEPVEEETPEADPDDESSEEA